MTMSRVPTDDVRIRFIGRGTGVVSVLELDVPGEWRELDRLKRALFGARIQVLSSQSQRFGERLVHWLRVVQFDGSPIHEWRRAALEEELRSELGPHRIRRRIELGPGQPHRHA